MINYKGISGFAYEKFESYDALVQWMQSSEIFNDPRVEWHDLGVSSDSSKNIYGISVGDTSSKPVIFIEHQIHGRHEWRCSHWGFKWIEKLINHDLNNAQVTRDLLNEFSFFIIPCLNPYGYENTEYGNANNVNLNRNFDWYFEENDDTGYGTSKGPAPFSEPESQIVRDLVLEMKPYLFIDTHTRGENVIGSMYQGNERFNLPFTYEIASSYRLSSGEGIAHSPTSLKPMAYAWAAQQPSITGERSITFMLEAPDLQTENEQARLGFYQLTLACLYTLRYKQNRMMRQYR